MTFAIIRNIVLTAVLAYLAIFYQKQGNKEASYFAVSTVVALWMHSGRRRKGDPGPTTPSAAGLPLTCLALLPLCLSACDSRGYGVEIGARVLPAAPQMGVQARLLTDAIELKPGSSPTFSSGRAGIYASNSDNLLYTTDGAGLTLKLHAAQSLRTSASCAGLSSPAAGDVCYDTTLSAPRFFTGSWSTLPTDSLVVHLAGTETITGAKTHTAALTMSGAGIAMGTQKITGLAPGTASGEAVAAQRSIGVTAPITGGGDLTSDRTIGLSYSSTYFDLAGGALVAKAGALVYQAVSGGGTGALGAATVYLGATNAAHGTTEYPQAIAARAGSARNLRCYLGTAPGGSDTVAVTARVAGADSTLTCTITGAAQTCADTTHAPTVAAGDRLATKAVSSAGTAAALVCTWEVTN